MAESQNQKHMRTKWQVVVFLPINGEQENCQTSSLLKYYLEVLGKNLQNDLHLPFFDILQLLIGTLSDIQLYIGSQSRVFNMSESAPALTGWINEGW